MNRSMLREQLIRHEGRRKKPYVDTVGKVSIGVGRNLTDRGLSPAEIDYLFENDIDSCIADLDNNLPWWRELSDARQHVLLDMCFNMGIKRLLKFVNTLADVQAGRYNDAADNMLKSKWAGQVGQRAKTLARMMRDG